MIKKDSHSEEKKMMKEESSSRIKNCVSDNLTQAISFCAANETSEPLRCSLLTVNDRMADYLLELQPENSAYNIISMKNRRVKTTVAISKCHVSLLPIEKGDD